MNCGGNCGVSQHAQQTPLRALRARLLTTRSNSSVCCDSGTFSAGAASVSVAETIALQELFRYEERRATAGATRRERFALISGPVLSLVTGFEMTPFTCRELLWGRALRNRRLTAF